MQLQYSQKKHVKETYAVMLHMALLDGYINVVERNELLEYQQTHGITSQTHEKLLNLHGWEQTDYDKGEKFESLKCHFSTIMTIFMRHCEDMCHDSMH